MYAHGSDTKRLAVDLLEIIKDALIYSDAGRDNLLSRITAIEAQEILQTVSVSKLLKDAEELEKVISKEKQNQNFLLYLELCLLKMAEKEAVYKAEETKPVKTEETKAEEVIEKTETAVSEPEPETPVEPILKTDIHFLLSILLDANKDLKINDQIIYNKLDLYRYEPEKRKFYQLLINTELFASNKDAIIISGSKLQADSINTKEANKELYFFINEEFGIDKMIYGIDQETKKELISLYKQTPAEERNKAVYVEKYKIEKKKAESPEERLLDLFGDQVKIEE